MNVLIWLALACAGGDAETGDTDETAPPTLAADLQPIFDRNCTGSCHVADTHSSGLDLTEGNAHAGLVDVASVQVPGMLRVAPGDPDGSYLLHKLQGTHAEVGGSGTAMPPYLVLADNEQELFRRWVADGAPAE